MNDAVGEHQARARRGVGVVIRCAAAGLAACVMLVCGGASAEVAAVVGPAHAWVTDGDVLAITSAGGSTYVGGSFRLIGRSTGSWAEVDSAGAVGAIRAGGQGTDAVADGRGGWFLRGDISSVGGVDVGQTEVVHLRANGSLDPDWNIRTDGDIHTMARAGDRLYVGGSFTRLDGRPRKSLGAIHARSGALLDWGPTVAGRTRNDVGVVDTIAATSDGSVLFIGGDFGHVDGALRKSLAAIGADGALRPFDAGAGYASSGERRRMRKSSAPASRSWNSIHSGVRSTWPATSKCSAVQSVRGSEPWTRDRTGPALESRLRRGRVGHRRGSGRLSGVRRRRVRVDRRQVASRAGCGRRPPRIGDALRRIPESAGQSTPSPSDAARKVVALRRRVQFRRRHRPNQPRRRGHAHRVGDVMGCPRRGHCRPCRPPSAPEPSRSGEMESSGHCDGTASQR